MSLLPGKSRSEMLTSAVFTGKVKRGPRSSSLDDIIARSFGRIILTTTNDCSSHQALSAFLFQLIISFSSTP